jgi:site-specific recombinase XerC
MNMLVPALTVEEESLPITLRAALEGAADLARAEKAPATKRAYGSDFAIFRAWCADQGLCPLPAEPAAVAAFIAAEAARGIKCATLGRRVAGIRHAHKLAGLPSPTEDERVKAVMRGARRTLGVAPVKKSAATSDKVLAMVAGGARGLAGKRDQALLLLGFALAARRSELVALDVADLEECPEGLGSRSGGRRRIRKALAPWSRCAAARSPARSQLLGIGSPPPASPRARCFVGLAKAAKCCPIGSERRASPSS